MRDHPLPPPPEPRRATPPDWLSDLKSILSASTGPAENRLEAFLDRLEGRP